MLPSKDPSRVLNVEVPIDMPSWSHSKAAHSPPAIDKVQPVSTKASTGGSPLKQHHIAVLIERWLTSAPMLSEARPVDHSTPLSWSIVSDLEYACLHERAGPQG